MIFRVQHDPGCDGPRKWALYGVAGTGRAGLVGRYRWRWQANLAARSWATKGRRRR